MLEREIKVQSHKNVKGGKWGWLGRGSGRRKMETTVLEQQ